MQNYYEMVIRNNKDSIYAMKKAIYAVLFHFTDLYNSYECHQFWLRDANKC